jgi:1,4-alpha-glucan branching enzyme
VRDLNGAYASTPAAWKLDSTPEGFQWIDANDAGRNVYSFVRRSPGSPDLVCVTNFSAIPHGDFRLPLPSVGNWTELLNTDAALYGGSGVGNLGSATAVAADPLDSEAPGGLPAYTTIVVPPLATVWFRGPS